MIKNKYQRLNKDEKRLAREKYYQTKVGAANKTRFIRLLICGLLCIIYSIVLVVDTIIEQKTYWYYILAGTMFIFGLVFLIGRAKLIVRNVNNYLLKNK